MNDVNDGEYFNELVGWKIKKQIGTVVDFVNKNIHQAHANVVKEVKMLNNRGPQVGDQSNHKNVKVHFPMKLFNFVEIKL